MAIVRIRMTSYVKFLSHFSIDCKYITLIIITLQLNIDYALQKYAEQFNYSQLICSPDLLVSKCFVLLSVPLQRRFNGLYKVGLMWMLLTQFMIVSLSGRLVVGFRHSGVYLVMYSLCSTSYVIVYRSSIATSAVPQTITQYVHRWSVLRCSRYRSSQGQSSCPYTLIFIQKHLYHRSQLMYVTVVLYGRCLRYPLHPNRLW